MKQLTFTVYSLITNYLKASLTINDADNLDEMPEKLLQEQKMTEPDFEHRFLV